MKRFTRMLCLLLVFSMLLAQGQPIIAAAAENDTARIVSADMGTDSGDVSNLEGYYSNEEWAAVYPQGLFVVEYSTYEVCEGGADPENPEDVYLGIVVYRIGGNALGSTLTYTLTCVSGDADRYPDSVGTLEFAPQQTTAIAKIRIYNDDVRNSDQLLMFSLGGCTTGELSNKGTAVIRIADDEPYVTSKISLSVSQVVTDKSAGNIRVTVKRTENDADLCTLRLTTADGTAIQGVDYEAITQELVFMAGQTEQTVTIPLVQSDDVYTEARYFTVSITELKGCEAADGDSLRLNLTNLCDPDTKAPVNIDDSQADLTVDESESLIDSSESILNTNDTIDRAALLRTVVGTANGTAVQPQFQSMLLAQSEAAGYWDAEVIVSSSEFRQSYCTGNDWDSEQTYTDGNENLMLISTNTYDLTQFYGITPKFSNISEKIITQFPNTAFGYLTDGSIFDQNEFPCYVKSAYADGVASDMALMDQYEFYCLTNHNFQTVNALNVSTIYPLTDSSGTRLPNTVGADSSKQKLFYMIYDDENWDDTNFTLGNTVLRRAVIPFSQFDMTGINEAFSDFQVLINEENPHMSQVQFHMDGFCWTIMVDSTGGGGVGPVPGTDGTLDADCYGFFVGSSLKIAYRPLSGSDTNLPVPQYVYLVDGKRFIHNSVQMSENPEMLADGSTVIGTMKLQTLPIQDMTVLQDSYFMTSDQAQSHNGLLAQNLYITSGWSHLLGIEYALVLKPSVTLSFNSLPTLKAAKIKTDGTLETEEEHRDRIYGILKDVVIFYDINGKRMDVDYSIDLDNCTLDYDPVEFSYLAVNPEAAGGGNRIRSNLYDLDLVNFGSYEEISNETCTQIGTGVELTLFNENTTYIPPQITIDSVGVSSKTASGFKTEFTANSLADFLNFEVLHYDTSASPALSYYTVHFTISDIYVGKTQDGVKEFPVTVFYETTDGRQRWELLHFTFKGGAGLTEAQDVELGLPNNSAYTTIDQSTADGVDAAGYKPVLQLLDYTSAGYQYVLYIPSYYDYQNTSSKLMNAYTERFRGADGISFDMYDYDKQDGTNAAEIICTVDAQDIPYVAPYVEPVVLDSEGSSFQSTYFEEQRNFYTYNDSVVALNAMTFNWDTSNLTTILSKILMQKDMTTGGKYLGLVGGTGPYVQHVGKNQVTFGIKLSLNHSNNNAPEQSAALTEAFQADHSKSNYNKRWNSGSLGTATGTVDAKVVWNYNALTQGYDFTQFTISLNGSLSVSKNLPIPCLWNLVYASFSGRFSFGISTGGTHVLDYVDSDGNSHYKMSWDGLTISPGFVGSIGVGFGLANLASAEIGGTLALSLSVKLGKQTYVAAQQEFDLDSVKSATNDSYTVEYIGDWKTYKPSAANATTYSYNNTLCESAGNGTIVIRSSGTSFQLVGLALPDGGEFQITVTDPYGNVLSGGETTTCSTDSSRTELYKTLYFWERGENYQSLANTDFVVTIVNESGKPVSLDSFRIYNRDYTDKSTIIPAALNALTLRISMYIKFCVVGISFSFDPAYLLLSMNDPQSNSTFTIGTIGHSKTWVVAEAEPASSAPLLLATQSKTASTSAPDYFNTGEYSEDRTQQLLQEDISNTAKTQTLSYHGSTYTFYTVLDTDSATPSFYQLYCSVDGQPGKLVCDDIFVADFLTFIDGSDRLAVAATCSDSTVKAMYSGSDGAVMETTDGSTIAIRTTEDLKEALVRTCVKRICLNVDSNGAITGTDSTVLGSTDNGQQLQDSNPVGVAAGTNTFVFYTSCSSSEASGLTSSWEGTSQADQDMVNGLLAALYQGNSQLFVTVCTASGETVTQQLPLHESLTAQSNAIISITSMDAVAYGSTVSLAYTVEVDNCMLGTKPGTLKQIHYLQLTVDDQGQVSCSDTVIIDSVFDYDENLTTVFGEDLVGMPSRYYNSSTGELYDSIILRGVQLELAVIDSSGTAVSSEAMTPCLFYQTNSSIHYVTYDALQDVLDGSSSGAGAIGVLYSGAFDDYIIAVSPEGTINLIYNDCTETSAYTDTLYFVDYNPENKVWNKPRRLTYTDVFDAQALENHQPTGSLTFDNLSAFVDAQGKVTIALLSSYAPFSYEYGAIADPNSTDDEIKLEQYYDAVVKTDDNQYIPYVVMPIQDYSSPAARSDVYMITFADRVKDVAVTDLSLSNTIFTQGEEISAQITLENTGDYIFSAMKVSLYYRNLDTNSRSIAASQVITGAFLAGDSMTTTLSYTVGSSRIADNTLLGVLITDATGRITYYDSYTDSYLPHQDGSASEELPTTYHVIHNAPEFYFGGVDVDIDSSGNMHYTMELGNCGTEDAQEDVTVYFRLYNRDAENGTFTKGKTLFSVTVNASRLSAGVTATLSDSYDVSNYLDEGSLYYAFELYSRDEQFSTANDSLPMQVGQQIPEVTVQSILHASGEVLPTDGRIVRNLTLGDEFEINTAVLAQYFKVSDLRVYEIGTSCLSIDNSAQDGIARVKVVALPNDHEGYIKLLISLDGTVINKYLYLHISNRATLDLTPAHGDGNWTLSGEDFVYATNYDLLSTSTDGSTLRFDFYGSDLKLYGDRLTNGGSFQIVITDQSGATVANQVVSTAGAYNDRGVMLYGCDDLDYGHYTVTLEAQLSNGQQLVLDHIGHQIDTSDADTTPYTVVEYVTEALDAPLLSGRNREATLTLTFSEAVELAPGKELANITLELAEYELVDGQLTPTGSTVTFTASQLDGSRLVLGAQLSSTPGAVRVYALVDSAIPADCLISADGQAVDPTIPNYSTVTYVLRESGIMSVTVADDPSMPNGSIQKSVQVKFLTAPNTDRLEGTRLIYTTDDPDGTQRTVDFWYAGMTDDPRVAVYRADELTLQTEELTKLLRYQQGIVLNRDQYVLVTADGDYLENDITTVLSDTSVLNISYTKLRAEQTKLIISGGQVQVHAVYPEAVAAGQAQASVQVRRTLSDPATGQTQQTDLTLKLSAVQENGTVLVFAADTQETLPTDRVVTYQLLSDAILYDESQVFITRGQDGIAINPSLPAAQSLTFRTDASITEAQPFVDEAGMLCARVTFSTAMDPASLADTSLDLTLQVTEYTTQYTQTVKLTYLSCQTAEGCTTAVYASQHPAAFDYEQISKTVIAPKTLTVPAGSSLLTAEGLICGNAVLDPQQLTMYRQQAADAQLQLVPNGSHGYDVVLTVRFDMPIQARTLTNVYAVALMQTGSETEEIYLGLEQVQDDTLTFRSTFPVIPAGGQTVTFTARERFADPYGAIVDQTGTAVSELLPDAELVWDLSGTGKANSAVLSVTTADKNQLTVTLRVGFDTPVAPEAFQSSTVDLSGQLTYLDGSTSALNQSMAFCGIEQGQTAVYTAQITLPSDADTIRFTLGEQNIAVSDPLYSADYTTRLSTDLPECQPISITRTGATGAAITTETGYSSLFVTYAQPIAAQDLSGIRLTAQSATGAVVFTGYAVSGSVLELRAEGDWSQLSVTDGVLILSDGASIWDVQTGLAVSLAVPDVSGGSSSNPGGTEDIPSTDDLPPFSWLPLLLLALALLLALTLPIWRRKQRTF